MIAVGILILSFFLDGISSNYLMWMPSFTFLTLLFIYPLFYKKEGKYLTILVITSLFYDLAYNNILLWSTVLYLAVYFFFLRYRKKIGLLEGMLAFIVISFLGYSLLRSIGYSKDIFLFLQTVITALPLVFLYEMLLSFLLFRIHPKRKMNY